MKKNYFQTMVVDSNEEDIDGKGEELNSARLSLCSFDQLGAELMPTNLTASIKAHDSGLGLDRNCLAICPKGKLIATGGADRSLKVWSVEERIIETMLFGMESEILKIKFHPIYTIIAVT
jgi:WD40 repeat protein